MKASFPSANEARSTHPKLRTTFRLQWEPVQDAYVLLYPEGMVRLSRSAGEILYRCDGLHDLEQMVRELETLFGATGLAGDVQRFVDHARERGWLS